MTTDQPGSISIDDLTLRFSKQDVDEAYDRGLAEGRRWPASGGVVEPSPLTAEEATPDCVVPAWKPGDRFSLAEVRWPHETRSPYARRQHDPGALIEEPDLYPKVHDPDDERRADDAHMAAGEALMEHEAEQGEGGAR